MTLHRTTRPERGNGTPAPAGSAQPQAAASSGPFRPFSRRALFDLLAPLLVEQALVNLVGLASSIMVAVVGEDAVSGVSLVEFVMIFFFAVFAALAAGGTVISAQYLGRRDRHAARDAADQLLRFSALVGIGVALLVWLGRSFILDIVFGSISEGVHRQALTYLDVMVLSLPSIPLYCACAAIFRTVGNARIPMFASMLMGAVNVVGCALAVFVLDAGTFGVAVATCTARWSSCLCILVVTCTKTFPLRPYATLLRPLRWGVIFRILRVGVPFGFENGLFHLGRIAILSLVATYGTTAIAANAVAGTICFFCVLPGATICIGGPAVVARCVGAGDFEAARFYTRKLLAIAYVSLALMALFIVLVLPGLLSLYALSPQTTQLARTIVLWHLAMDVIFWPVAFCLPLTFRSAGDVRYPMIVGVLVMFGCRVFLAWVLGTVCGMGVLGTWYAMFLDWIVRAVCFVTRYRGTRWTKFHAI